MKRDEQIAMTLMAREAVQLREMNEAWVAWAVRVLGDSGVKQAHRMGARAMRDLLAKFAKAGAEDKP